MRAVLSGLFFERSKCWIINAERPLNYNQIQDRLYLWFIYDISINFKLKCGATISELTFQALALCQGEWSNSTTSPQHSFFRNSVSTVYSDDHVVWSWGQSFQDCFLNDGDWRIHKMGEVIIRLTWGVVYWTIISTLAHSDWLVFSFVKILLAEKLQKHRSILSLCCCRDQRLTRSRDASFC